MTKDSLKQEFTNVFRTEPKDIFFAPGRVNLIGEHIDYNGGLVMPCAITFGTILLSVPNADGIFRLRSLNFDTQLDIPVQEAYKKRNAEWYNYPLGVINGFLEKEKKIHGLDILYYGDVPIGSGLSSSASIEIVTAFALNELFDSGFSKLELVLLAKRVENQFIGVNSGIMDQFAVTFGEESKALKLNCETLEYDAVPLNLDEHLLAIVNTNKPRQLRESKYNERVQECAVALQLLKKHIPVNNLCDLDTKTFERYKDFIEDDLIRNRARHVVEENERVKVAAEALAAHDLIKFGQLMYASHDSLKNLYEVSGKELDTIVEFCLEYPDVTGARMTGAGFGGCAIALVKRNALDDFSKRVCAYYEERIGYQPSVYSSTIGSGVKRVED